MPGHLSQHLLHFTAVPASVPAYRHISDKPDCGVHLFLRPDSNCILYSTSLSFSSMYLVLTKRSRERKNSVPDRHSMSRIFTREFAPRPAWGGLSKTCRDAGRRWDSTGDRVDASSADHRLSQRLATLINAGQTYNELKLSVLIWS